MANSVILLNKAPSPLLTLRKIKASSDFILKVTTLIATENLMGFLFSATVDTSRQQGVVHWECELTGSVQQVTPHPFLDIGSGS